ncbi:neutral zinc metallopeptidase [Streptomyces sp. 8N616]|uniref:neutral zinc metallopeptidase n=1 Tax=Streptomyces sp. 8N616 TaxID=3457414 RepID=UPI003FD4E28D
MDAPWHTRVPRLPRVPATRVAALLFALVLAVLAVLATGCGSGAGTGPGGRTTTTSAPPHSDPPPPPPSPVFSSPAATAQDTVEEDIESAVEVVNRYWSDHWSELFTGTYRPPTVLGGYDGSAARVPTCGGEPLTDDNAVYCSPADYLAWDVDLMNAGHRAGDAWVYLVIAHEWGHAVQNRLDTDLVALQLELQADCLAGAVLFGAAEDGALRFEEGDTDELTQALTVLADDTPWTKSSDHGDASERIGAFNKGADSGVTGCIPG